MPEISVTINDTQNSAMAYVSLSPQEWLENCIVERARQAVDEIVKLYTERALDEGVQIPATRELIVADAFTRGWVQTAAQRDAADQAVAE